MMRKVALDAARARIAVRQLRNGISDGWYKYNGDGSKSFFGQCPSRDLYDLVIRLEPGCVDSIFDLLARRVAACFPDRITCAIESPYDARVIVLDFNHHPDTSQADLMSLLFGLD